MTSADERPVFGVDRLPQEEAEAAPARRRVSEAEKEVRWRRELRVWGRKRLPPPPDEAEPDEEQP